jgi:hypothetical protein
MAIAWFICEYKIKQPEGEPRPTRYCAMDDFTATIRSDGGDWAESEVLGGYAVVKVRASASTLTTIAGTARFQRIPNWVNLSDTLESLTTAQRTAILNKILAMGYTQAEIDAVIGANLAGWRTKTLGQVLRFIASKRLKPRWDATNQQIVLDGILQACRAIDDVDTAVSNT